MTAANVLGLLLGVLGAAGMYVAGRGRWQGWAMGLAIQPVWAAFAIVVESWTLLLIPLMYGSVYARNLWRWRRDAKSVTQIASQPCTTTFNGMRCSQLGPHKTCSFYLSGTGLVTIGRPS